MRKKIFSFISILMLIVSFSATNLFAEDAILGETLVEIYTYVEDLPEQFVKGSNIKTYEYGGEEIYDFREYFEVYDNAEIILNMHDVSGEIDLGGYVWETDFNIDVAGIYTVSLTYDGVTGEKSNSIELEVIEEDVEAPSVFMIDGNFNIVREDDEAGFLREFDRFIYSIRVYDKVDGVIEINIDDFKEEQIEQLQSADLNDKISIDLIITDNAGNEASEEITLTVVDLMAPNIHNIKTITTRKGKRINYTNHLEFVDNYTERENIQRTYTIYKTLVKKNIWILDSRRASQSEGNELGNYLRLTTNNLDNFINYLNDNYSSVYQVGDYYEVVNGDEVTYVTITEKTEDNEGNLVNTWEKLSTKSDLKGDRLEKFVTINQTREELLLEIEDDHEEGFKENDYYQTLDLETNDRFYIYIKEKEDVLRDEQQTIDFNQVGVQYVRVQARDEAGNTASATYRVVVDNGITFFQSILIVNGIVFAVAGIGVGIFLITKRRK